MFKEKVCIVCGCSFVPSGGRQSYCSDKCFKQRQKEYYENNKESINKKRAEKYIKKEKFSKHCENCLKVFETNNSRQKYCCKACLEEQNKINYRTKYNKNKEKREIYRKNNKEKKKIYDKQYRKENKEAISEYQKKYHQTEKGKKANKAGLAKRRARKLGAPITEKIDYDMINERDGFKCCICHKKVDMELKHPHPMSKSHDHIVPLSKGGEDSNRNIQLTHLKCNVSKNNNISNGVQMHLL